MAGWLRLARLLPMLVRARKTIRTDDGAFKPGSVVELNDQLAKFLLERGDCERFVEPIPTQAVGENASALPADQVSPLQTLSEFASGVKRKYRRKKGEEASS